MLRDFKAIVGIWVFRHFSEYSQLPYVSLGRIFGAYLWGVFLGLNPLISMTIAFFCRRIFFVVASRQSDVLRTVVASDLLKDAHCLCHRLFYKSGLIVSLRLSI